ncbi:hypothetical protein [Actinoplanes sp. NPDC051851]|uniref:hypothetical protein n=1 Tax=Actinoplanes sp. NPDC051851 TaxID=3154753 RepID=UPI00343D0DF7
MDIGDPLARAVCALLISLLATGVRSLPIRRRGAREIRLARRAAVYEARLARRAAVHEARLARRAAAYRARLVRRQGRGPERAPW